MNQNDLNIDSCCGILLKFKSFCINLPFLPYFLIYDKIT